MFMFGAFSIKRPSNNVADKSLQHQLSPWIEKIRRRAGVEISYANNCFLAGAGSDFCNGGADWYRYETSNCNGLIVHMQAHGHPKSLPVLASLAKDFGDFDRRRETIKSTLHSLNTEYLCVFYSAKDRVLYIVSDKIGIVPAYTYRHNDTFYYATALWTLKLIDQFRDDADWQGIAEKLFFRAQLANRTIYKHVSRVVGGSIALVTDETKIFSYYKLWEQYRALPPEDVPSLLAEGFQSAIVDRLDGRSVQYSTLSGGLDSRTVVAALSHHAQETVTFNFAATRTLDALLSEQFAKRMGTRHHQHPTFALHYPNFSTLSRSFLDKIDVEGAQQPQAIWTGDDGSISIGFVYLRRHLLNQINALDNEKAPEFILENSRVLPPRIFDKRRYAELRALAVHGVEQFCSELHDVDHATKYYCFLMLNRVVRMFEEHYETAHLHRTFRCMPFLDVRAIEPVLSADMPTSSEHRLYLNFAKIVDWRILDVPWQAYPGHEPCPLPLPNGRNQWQGYDAAESRFLRRTNRKNMLRVMTSRLWRNVVRREMLAAYVLRDLLAIEATGGIANALHEILNEYAFNGKTEG